MADQKTPTFDFTGLIPAPFDGYSPVVESALSFFVSQLPPRRRRSIARAVEGLGGAGPAAVAVLAAECPTLHKLAQMLARDERLDSRLRLRLQQLESLPAGRLTAAERRALHHELEKLDAVAQVELSSWALARGSVAFVSAFSFIEQQDAVPSQGVFKVLLPGVASRLEEELRVWPRFGEHIEQQCQERALPTPDFREIAAQVRRLLEREVDLGNERRNLEIAHEQWSGDHLVVPRLLPFCTSRLSSLERLEGCKITDAEGEDQRARLARSAARALIGQPLLQAEGDALFHGDPHAGNLIATGDGKVAAIDWSLAGRLTKEDRVQLTRMVVGGLTLNPKRIRAAVDELAAGPAHDELRDRAIHSALRRVRRGIPPGALWMIGLVDELIFCGAVQWSDELLLFRKGLLTLRGVMRDLSPKASLDLQLWVVGGRQALADWPQRFRRGPFGRDFGTHLSNAELLPLMFSGPRTAVRFWSQTVRDLVAR